MPKEISLTGRAREKEGNTLSHFCLDDVWAHVHREVRGEAVNGYTFMAPSAELTEFMRSRKCCPWYGVHTWRLRQQITRRWCCEWPPQRARKGQCLFVFRGGLWRMRQPWDACGRTASVGGQRVGTRGVVGGGHGLPTEWCRAKPSLGFTDLHCLVREGTPLSLAPGAKEYLEVQGHMPSAVEEAYGLLVSLLAHRKEVVFWEDVCARLRYQLQCKEVWARQQADR